MRHSASVIAILLAFVGSAHAQSSFDCVIDPSETLKLGSPMINTGFGLGVSVQVAVGEADSPGRLGEHGWSGAASTNFWISPRERLIGISLTQHRPFSASVANAFRPLVYEAVVESRHAAER